MTTTITTLNEETTTPLTAREERMFRFLIADESPYVRFKALSNPACPEHILYEAAKTETHPKALTAIATHPEASGRILHLLVGSAEHSVRNAVASHAHTRAADLITLSTVKNIYVLGWVVLNPNAPKKAVTLALKTALSIAPMSDFVPFHVARHPRASQSVLRSLESHWSSRVRAEVLKNPNAPFGVVQRLMGDDDDLVRGALASRLGVSVRVSDVAS